MAYIYLAVDSLEKVEEIVGLKESKEDFRVQILKCKLSFKKLNCESAKKFIDQFQSIDDELINPIQKFLIANMYYLKKNFEDSITAMNQAIQNEISVPESVIISYFNNIACILFCQSKFRISGHYFSKALELQINSSHAHTLFKSWNDCKHVIYYNSALQSLAKGETELSLSLFEKASLNYHYSPLLWIRMAQCCTLNDFNQSRLQYSIFNFSSKKNHAIVRKEVQLCKKSILSAIRFCEIALSLIQKTNPRECNLRNIALLHLAYAYLRIQNPRSALNCVSLLIDDAKNITEISYLFLAHLYAAQSSCQLNDPVRALKHLSSCEDLSANLDFAKTISHSVLLPIYGSTRESLLLSLFHTFAVSFILKGDLDQAQVYAEKMHSLSPKDPSCVQLRIYLYMKTSNKGTNLFKALSLLSN
jgi:tetratricopeptide (TPR) repeat protein